MRSFLIFAGAALLGAGLALAVRTVLHRPYDPAPPPTQQLTPRAPLAAPTAPPATATAAPAVARTSAPAGSATAGSASAAPINTICPVCGGPVDPALETSRYQGKVIGFNCLGCKPQFDAAPDRFGPAALLNKAAD